MSTRARRASIHSPGELKDELQHLLPASIAATKEGVFSESTLAAALGDPQAVAVWVSGVEAACGVGLPGVGGDWTFEHLYHHIAQLRGFEKPTESA